jgi:hypothetical protein
MKLNLRPETTKGRTLAGSFLAHCFLPKPVVAVMGRSCFKDFLTGRKTLGEQEIDQALGLGSCSDMPERELSA